MCALILSPKASHGVHGYSERSPLGTANTMAAAALRELTGFRELLLEMPPKRVFREPKNAKEENENLDSIILRGMPQSGLTKYLARSSGKVQEEIRTPTLRKQDTRSNWTVFKVCLRGV